MNKIIEKIDSAISLAETAGAANNEIDLISGRTDPELEFYRAERKLLLQNLEWFSDVLSDPQLRGSYQESQVIDTINSWVNRWRGIK